MSGVRKLLGTVCFAIAFGCIAGAALLLALIFPELFHLQLGQLIALNTMLIAAGCAGLAAIGAYLVGAHLYNGKEARSFWVRTLGIFGTFFLIVIAALGVSDPATPYFKLVVVPAMALLVASLLVQSVQTVQSAATLQSRVLAE
jgi:hypothetical protein